MNSIEEKQASITEDFSMMGDGFGKYSYLVQLAGCLPPMEETNKTDDNLVRGCQSRVWLTTRVENGLFYFEADSDTLIIKGVLYLLREVLWGQAAGEVAAAKLDFLGEADIMATFDADRQKGIGYIIKTIRDKAASLASCGQ
jgi:cysteine desulfuration protein SufE